MDQPHGRTMRRARRRSAPHGAGRAAAAGRDDSQRNVPQDDDERFIVGLVLTYYRRHPQRARARLLDLLGEVLTPAPAAARQAPAATPAAPAGRRPRPVEQDPGRRSSR